MLEKYELTRSLLSPPYLYLMLVEVTSTTHKDIWTNHQLLTCIVGNVGTKLQ